MLAVHVLQAPVLPRPKLSKRAPARSASSLAAVPSAVPKPIIAYRTLLMELTCFSQRLAKSSHDGMHVGPLPESCLPVSEYGSHCFPLPSSWHYTAHTVLLL